MPGLERDANIDVAERFSHALKQRLESVRAIDRGYLDDTLKLPGSSPHPIHDILSEYAACLRAASKIEEAEALDIVRTKATEQPAFGGLGIVSGPVPTDRQYEEAVFLCESWLESLNSRDRAPQSLRVSNEPTPGARPMTLAEKIFAHHCAGRVPPTGLSAGDVVVVNVDWVLASELSWAGMARTYEQMGSPGIWRNDRFWLAGDHVVHPSITHVPKIKAFVETAEKAKKAFKMTEYQGMNYTIMHTEFVRERAEPGMLCVGSDSHTCSAGAAGCLAIGLGTADVMMTLALGETWFKVPESILIEIQGEPAVGISGKDVILHILKVFKRNTVAAERIVEFAGPGLQHLSYDARFAISNMCTEFGAVTGVFVPDQVTKDFVDQRKRRANKSNSVYFKPDEGAQYAGRYHIDLAEVEPSIAVYPNPDDVVPVSEKAGMELDGVFIGACTTTEEELVLAALILKVGLAKGLSLARGKKHYVPGSLPTVERLRELGLLEVYEAAGFTRGPPGCSFCVGLSAEKAAEGETWLSSQNRNFKNRMGKGSIGHVTSAIVCAASAFSMTVTSPLEFLKEIDRSFLDRYKNNRRGSSSPVPYVQPDLSSNTTQLKCSGSTVPDPEVQPGPPKTGAPDGPQLIESKIVCLGDFIDTDAMAPGDTLTTCVTDEEFGEHVLKHTHPDFRSKVRAGQQVVVAGEAFGVGSSREVAVSALKGVGVRAVIAKSFAFIYQRNQPSLGLLGFTVHNDRFFELAEEGQDVTIDVPARQVAVGGTVFSFALSEIEYNLMVNKGIAQSYKTYGKSIWAEMMGSKPQVEPVNVEMLAESIDERLNW